MSYYDDLGVTPDATPEEIHQSYRNLVRILHPDRHTEPALQAAAENQMRRANHIYSILAEPEKRRRYDAGLAEPAPRSAPIVIHPLRPVKKASWLTGGLAWTVAAIASCGIIYWLSNQGQAPLSRELSREEANSETVETLRRELETARAERDAALATRGGFTGLWVNPRGNTGLIETTVVERNGNVRGSYRARDLNLEFEGHAAGALAQLRWKRGDGASGEMQLKLLSGNRLEVNWRATEQGQSGAPPQGTAVLVRRTDERPELR